MNSTLPSTTSNDERPVFLLGIGAQKAATSWLYQYLSRVENSDFGALKEYHAWDAFYSEMRNPKLGSANWFKCKTGRFFKKYNRHYYRHKFQNNTEAYFDYFTRLLSTDKITLTGDITPTYTSLGKEHFAEVKQKFEARGVRVKVVFIMRDPFDRCWSAVRMNRNLGYLSKSMTDEDLLLRDHKTHQMTRRTTYDTTLENVFSVFDKSDVHVAIYESLFTKSEQLRLAEFMQIPVDLEYAERKHNAIPASESVSMETRECVEDHFAAVYDYCALHYPEVKELWPRYNRQP